MFKNFNRQINQISAFNKLLATNSCLSLRNISISIVTKIDEKSSENIKKTASSRKLRIYTKTGDKGFTSLFTGERVPKSNIVFEALGNTDELNSSLGLAREYCLDMHSNNKELGSVGKSIEAKLVRIQCTLLDIGSFIATPKTKASEKQLERLSKFNSTLTSDLEKWIDEFELELPTLKNFILPSGGKLASVLHLSRAICRRAERSMHPLVQSNDLDSEVVIYVNRLSDFLFVCARYASMKQGKEETVYKKPS